MNPLVHLNRFLFLVLFCSPSFLFSGNTKKPHFSPENGKLLNRNALSIPRPYYRRDEQASFIFSLSYTYWVPYIEGLILANSPFPQGSNTLSFINTVTPSFSGKSGFQVEVAKYLHFDDWKCSAGYTWFYNAPPYSFAPLNPSNSYVSPWIEGSYTTIATLNSRYTNQFNCLRGTLDRSLAISPNFIFTPFGGVIGAWETSHLQIDAHIQLSPSELLPYTVDNTMYWWCIGPYGGVELGYTWIKNTFLFLKVASSINLAKKDFWQYQDTPTGSSLSSFNIQDHLWSVEPMFSQQLGIKLNCPLKDLSVFFDLSWEMQTWFSHMGFYTPGNQMGLSGNYSMQGLTVLFGIIF